VGFGDCPASVRGTGIDDDDFIDDRRD
jgi:hypothetical protein